MSLSIDTNHVIAVLLTNSTFRAQLRASRALVSSAIPRYRSDIPKRECLSPS